MLPPSEFAAAITTLGRALQEEPKMQRARFLLAKSYLAQQQPDTAKAIAQLNALLRENPAHRRAQRLRESVSEETEAEVDAEAAQP